MITFLFDTTVFNKLVRDKDQGVIPFITNKIQTGAIAVFSVATTRAELEATPDTELRKKLLDCHNKLSTPAISPILRLDIDQLNLSKLDTELVEKLYDKPGDFNDAVISGASLGFDYFVTDDVGSKDRFKAVFEEHQVLTTDEFLYEIEYPNQ